jgi:HEAT repeat protein
MTKASAKKVGEALRALGRSPAQLEADAGLDLLRQGLSSGDTQLIVLVARLIADHSTPRLMAELRATYRMLSGRQGVSADPGCVAKEALLDALAALDDDDLDLFADAANYEQLERIKGRVRETASGVRVRGVLGLARLGHPDFFPIMGARLAEREPIVRLNAARAIGHRGHRDGAGLLLLRLGAGESEPEVMAECFASLFAIAPDLGRVQARALIRDVREEDRSAVFGALGAAPSDEAIELLATELEESSLGEQRRSIIEALGLSRRPRARALLLELVAGDRTSDAEAALVALSVHRYDRSLVARLSELTSGSPSLGRIFRERFGEPASSR